MSAVEQPEMPDGARRVYAFATALGLTADRLVDLLETYDLAIMSPGTIPPWMERNRQDGDSRIKLYELIAERKHRELVRLGLAGQEEGTSDGA